MRARLAPRRLHRAIAPLAMVVAMVVALCAATAGAATITIVNNDGMMEGLNDPTPVAPVGGNPGTTLGAQRLFVYGYAAQIWGGILPSSVTILAGAAFNALSCNATSGVIGSAGPSTTARDFPGAPVSGHWYHIALANRLAGTDLAAGVNDINSQFNSSIGQTGCLEGTSWYYGIDGNGAPNQINFLSTVLHELGHGLGFSTTTSGATGGYASGVPHIWDRFLYDNAVGLHWDQMTSGQRAASANACTRLVWDGANVTGHAGQFLGGKPLLRIHAPGAIDGDYEVGTASFGPPLEAAGTSGDVVLADDATGTASDACEALVNGAAISGKVALVDRGNCPFAEKVKNAQDAGAIAVIVADNVAGCPPSGLGGEDPAIVIPAARVTQATGNSIKANLASSVNVTLLRDPTLTAGVDAGGRVRMYSPSTFSGGSSVSHFDVSADPDLLMEPFDTPLPPEWVDLAKWLFADIGWFNGPLAADDSPVATRARILAAAPNPFTRASAVQLAIPHGTHAELSVHDLAGRRVATLHRGAIEPGRHAFAWRGEDESGRAVAPGIYVYRLTTPEGRETRQTVLSR
jgi:hypothetical protein